ncbi:hypothetical protein RFI_13817 [Reticulomyxa filosa]|uniref:Uncharacterized protein n=1 Tax=Reticulomyxa filosa TaxID=46433 RepID=X6NC80_RETFI|nr:hypothetical protein RFI_13817 [Reticulomyxa filosa]|eukprot:ETO23364.1 hypothetical protein RFI_13817 [Reticulomyxa filosa]
MPSRKLDMEEMYRLEAQSLLLGQGSIFDHSINENVYKYAKENFVSNLTGSEWWEICLVISLFPVACFVSNIIAHYSIWSLKRGLTRNGWHQFILEFGVIVIPNVLCLCLNTHSWRLHIFVITLELFGGLLFAIKAKYQMNISLVSWNNDFPMGCDQQHKLFLSV